MSMPIRHRGHKFTGIALRVPLAIRVIPQPAGFRVQIIKDRVDHARIEQQPLDAHSVIGPTLVSWTAVYEEIRTPDADCRPAVHDPASPRRYFFGMSTEASAAHTRRSRS